MRYPGEITNEKNAIEENSKLTGVISHMNKKCQVNQEGTVTNRMIRIVFKVNLYLLGQVIIPADMVTSCTTVAAYGIPIFCVNYINHTSRRSAKQIRRARTIHPEPLGWGHAPSLEFTQSNAIVHDGI